MAQISPPTWTPKHITALPAMTHAAFNIASEDPAVGFQIEYDLQSAHIHFRMPGSGVLLPQEERDVSTPIPEPQSRTRVRIVDRYMFDGAAQMRRLKIDRGLAIERVSGGGPGIVHMSITVRELAATGQPTLPATKLATITFAMGV